MFCILFEIVSKQLIMNYFFKYYLNFCKVFFCVLYILNRVLSYLIRVHIILVFNVFEIYKYIVYIVFGLNLLILSQNIWYCFLSRLYKNVKITRNNCDLNICAICLLGRVYFFYFFATILVRDSLCFMNDLIKGRRMKHNLFNLIYKR